MSATIQQDKDDLWVMTVTGELKKSELDEIKALGRKNLGLFDRVKVLIVAKDFTGWEHGADWSDMSFFYWHGWKITRIAIVADLNWKDKFLGFSVAGMRRAPVQFFVTGHEAEARAWLEQPAANKEASTRSNVGPRSNSPGP